MTRRVDRCARALEMTGADAAAFARVAAPQLKDEIMTAARAAFGPDLKPWTGKNVKAGTGYDVDSTGRGVRVTFKLRPGGVWVYGEQGAGPHLIGGGRQYRRGTTRPRGGRTVRYVIGDGYAHPVAAPVLHPGHKGRRAIKYAFKLFRNRQRDAAAEGVRVVIRDAFRR